MREGSELNARFRFTHEPDAKAYGPALGEWWTYDEAAITALSWKELAALEEELHPLRLIEVMNGARASSIVGMHAASWLAIRLADKGKAGPYADYSPLVMRIEWADVIEDQVPEVAADPLDSGTTPSSSPAE